MLKFYEGLMSEAEKMSDKSYITELMMDFDLPSSSTSSKNNSRDDCQPICKNVYANGSSTDNVLKTPQHQSENHTYIANNYAADNLRQKKIKQLIDIFPGYSTLHGFHFIFNKEYKIRKYIWILIIGVSVAFLCQKLYESTKKYFEYPFSTTTTVNYVEELEFPAISLCNINDLRISRMNGTLLHDLIQSGIKENIGDKISGEEYSRTTKEANHLLQNMLYKCAILGQKCSYKNFTSFYQTQGEKCYTFNSGELIPKMKVEGTGTSSGNSFELVINIEHYEYYNDRIDAGVRLIIHEQNETPVLIQGFTLPPGMTSYVAVKKNVAINLRKPYKTSCGERNLKYYKHYSKNTCWLESLTNHVTGKCDCKDGFMPGQARDCSLKELENCTWPEWEKFKKQKDINCPIACEITTFDALLSFALFPSNEESDRIAKEFKLSGSTQENRKFIRDNFLRVVIYYDHMSFLKMEQTPSYDLMILLGDVGGQLGLFLGTSILTYIEFFDLLAMLIYTKYFEIFRVKTIPS